MNSSMSVAVLGFVGTSLLFEYLNSCVKQLKAKQIDGSATNFVDCHQKPSFLTKSIAEAIADSHPTPLFVYSESKLIEQAKRALSFPVTFGLTVRFAMKACPNVNILKLFHSLGLHFDASSGYEVDRALLAGVPASHISLSAQELPPMKDLKRFIALGVKFNACSFQQLGAFGRACSDESMSSFRQCGIRFNPGIGSGGTGKTNVGGPDASFGIWHEYADRVQQLASQYSVRICRIHTHIGSGSDPRVWSNATHLSLALVEKFPDVTTLNLGGGYKVARMDYEQPTDLQTIGLPVKSLVSDYHNRTGRQLDLEIEPGTYLVGNAGCLLCRVADMVDTLGPKQDPSCGGHRFIKLDTGMTELLRPAMYGAQHPILFLNDNPPPTASMYGYVVVGHCCESGDLFSCESGKSETLRTVITDREAKCGDFISIEGSGAYCSSMNTKNYNSYPEAAEVLLRSNGDIQCIRQRQTLNQIIQNEMHVL